MTNKEKLFDVSLNTLLLNYQNKIYQLEVDCVKDGLLITEIGDILLQICGDLKEIRLCYISNKFDDVFDLIICVNNKLSIIDEIIYPDLLEI